MAELRSKVVLARKGEEAYISVKQLRVALAWTAAVDLDLVAFYKAKDGRVGGVFSENYTGGSLGSLNSYPFIELSGDAGVGAAGGQNEEVLRITKLDEIAEIFICTLNFTDAIANQPSSFSRYDAIVNVVDDKGESVQVPLNSAEPGTVAVIARIDNTGMMGARMINENRVMDMKTFQSTVPGANLLQLASKIVLRKVGDSTTIPIKNLQVTLRWKTAVDLDLHAFFQLKQNTPQQKAGFVSRLLGGGSGQAGSEGHVYFASRGNRDNYPWIYLDKDAGVGDVGGNNEENMYLVNLENTEHILLVATIFNKPNANFSSYDGLVIVTASNRTFEVPLTATTGGNQCIIAHVDNSRPGGPVLTNVNKVQREEPTVVSFLRSR
ncbi:MAG: stress response protein [Armatimonadota bacterium]